MGVGCFDGVLDRVRGRRSGWCRGRCPLREVRCLCEAKATVDKANADGATPLYAAARARELLSSYTAAEMLFRTLLLEHFGYGTGRVVTPLFGLLREMVRMGGAGQTSRGIRAPGCHPNRKATGNHCLSKRVPVLATLDPQATACARKSSASSARLRQTRTGRTVSLRGTICRQSWGCRLAED